LEGLKQLRKELKIAIGLIEKQIDQLPNEDSINYDPSEEVIMRTKLRTIGNIVFNIECKVMRLEGSNILIHKANDE
tara:strand:- start:292 stop:519 length:228 start_codon:yes stop_codon:yes gene_type:complete